MEQLESAFAAIRAIHDTPAVQRLLLDCYALALKYGEDEGLRYAEMYRNSIADYEAGIKRGYLAARRMR